MNKETKYIVKFFNKNTKEFLGYQMKSSDILIYLTKNLDNVSTICNIVDNLDYIYVKENIIRNLKYTFRQKKGFSDKNNPISRLISDDFKGLKIKDISMKLVELNKELRRLKLKQLL